MGILYASLKISKSLLQKVGFWAENLKNSLWPAVLLSKSLPTFEIFAHFFGHAPTFEPHITDRKGKSHNQCKLPERPFRGIRGAYK